MKLRIRGNSIRLRLSQADLELLLATGAVEERVTAQEGKFIAIGDVRGRLEAIASRTATVRTPEGDVDVPIHAMPVNQAVVFGMSNGDGEGELARALFLMTASVRLDGSGRLSTPCLRLPTSRPTGSG